VHRHARRLDDPRAEDVLARRGLAADAGLDVAVVPLLETIDDLRGAARSSRSCSTAARASGSR
jgi:phosphoenolpyruvate carboxylase